jgi:LPS sulfotransferase NodH/glycosyltransferase involved in cell wall biosynthesis
MSIVPRRSLVIATTPRSGSWLLADTMLATGLLGEPQEYFSVEARPAWASTLGLPVDAPPLRYVEEVLAYGTGDDGLFAAKIHWTQLQVLARRVRAEPGEWPDDDGSLLDGLLPDLRYIHLRRADTARQAISYLRASATDQWWDTGANGPRRPPPDLDLQQVRWVEEMHVRQDDRWRRLIAASGRPSIEVVYEDFVEDRAGTVARILDLAEVTVDGPVELPEPRVKKQSDASTEEWVAAYRAVRGQLAGLPRRWKWSNALPGVVPLEVDADPFAPRARPWRPRPVGTRRPPARYGPTPELPWALRYLLDEEGEETGFVAVRGPIDDDDARLLAHLGRRRRVIGWTSYGPFPRVHVAFDGYEFVEEGLHGRERGYLADCEGWVHCFRHPERFLPPGRPRLLLSESDFLDPGSPLAEVADVAPAAKRWDVVYVCCPNDFNELTKNWRLARRCVTRLADELGTTALLVGRDEAPDVPDVAGVATLGELPWNELLAEMVRARVLLVPNVLDASPQLIVEALALDVPIVVNEAILGGWKYVNDATGRFFHDEDDVVGAVKEVMATDLHPVDWFKAQGGPKRAESRLAAFLRTLPTTKDVVPPPRPLRRVHIAGDVG